MRFFPYHFISMKHTMELYDNFIANIRMNHSMFLYELYRVIQLFWPIFNANSMEDRPDQLNHLVHVHTNTQMKQFLCISIFIRMCYVSIIVRSYICTIIWFIFCKRMSGTVFTTCKRVPKGGGVKLAFTVNILGGVNCDEDL